MPGLWLPNLHLYQNSSNLRIDFLCFLKDTGGQLAQLGSDGAIVSADHQDVPLKSDHPAGSSQRRWRRLPV